MLQLLIQFIMNIVVTIVNFIMQPFMAVIFALFPSLQVYFDYITQFFTSAFTYLATILQWLCFTPNMFILLFDYFAIKYTVYITVIAIKFAINIYNKLKP